MQSVASLMSIGKADIGNLDELEEEGEDQNEDHTFCSKISEITTQLSNLDEEDECFGNPFGNPFGDSDRECDHVECGILLFSFLFNIFILCKPTLQEFLFLTNTLKNF